MIIIAFGDFSWMRGPDSSRDVPVRPGMQTHPAMDVDLILIGMPDGTIRWCFLPGLGLSSKVSGAINALEIPSQYVVNADSSVDSETFGAAPPIPIGGNAWLKTWDKMVDDAKNGFPKGYKPIYTLMWDLVK